MNILIIGKSGSGKSRMCGLIMNFITMHDEDCRIITNDQDRKKKECGNGKNEYKIDVFQKPAISTDADKDTIPNLVLQGYDITIDINGNEFNQTFERLF
jgi:ABC-type glutathione transport system ATPase component